MPANIRHAMGRAVLVLLLAASASGHAQWSPTRPVRLIAPFPPGGAVDTVARIVTTRLPQRLGQQVVVDNRGGANASIGTDLAAELFKVLTGTDMVGINYKGGGPALTDLIGGQISVFFSGVASGAAQIKAGKIRALGVTTLRRSGALPDVPTIAESGVPGYEVDGWYGLLAPAATPPAVIARYNRDLSALVVTPEMNERLLRAGIDAQPSTPAEFHQRITRDIARWAEVVKKARIAVE